MPSMGSGSRPGEVIESAQRLRRNASDRMKKYSPLRMARSPNGTIRLQASTPTARLERQAILDHESPLMLWRAVCQLIL